MLIARIASLALTLVCLTVSSTGAASARVAAGGNLLVNEAPFFPIGIYHVSWIGDRQGVKAVPDLHTIAEAGFNLIHPTIDARPDMADLFDAAEARGVLMIGEVPWPANGPDGFINLWKHRAPLIGWNIQDDFNAPYSGPPSHPPSSVAARRDVIDTLAPDHVAYASGGSYPGFEVRDYAGTMDVMGMQSYPVDAGNSDEEYWLEENVDSFDYVEEELEGTGQLFIASPQAFAWQNRWPSTSEARNLLYAPLIRGAKGAIWYTFWHGGKTLAQAQPSLWADITTQVAELKSLTPFLLDGVRTEIATGSDRVHAAAWQLDGQVVVVVLGTERTSAHSVALALPADATNPAHALFPGRSEGGMTVVGSQLEGTIGPEEVHVYLIDVVPSGSQPPTAVITATPADVAFDETVMLDAGSSFDLDGTVVAYQWDLGDGILATGASLNHAYQRPGRYFVRLTVRDDEGTPNTAIVSLDVGITSLCDPTPRLGCDTAQSSSIDVRESTRENRRRLSWSWSHGEIAPADLGDPTTTTEYALCMYDAGGRVLATGVRPGSEEWKNLGAGGYQFKDRSGTPGGLVSARWKPAAGAAGSLRLKARGAGLPVSPLPFALPVSLQLVRSGAPVCWEATYDGGALSTPERFSARTSE